MRSMYEVGDRAPVGNPRVRFVADLKSMPDERQRQPQTNLRKCGNQPAHKSMPTVGAPGDRQGVGGASPLR